VLIERRLTKPEPYAAGSLRWGSTQGEVAMDVGKLLENLVVRVPPVIRVVDETLAG
jgi:hypothetical protein